jgi:hypothetical protein
MTDVKEIQKDLKAELPEQVKWQIDDAWLSFNFSRLKHSLTRVTDEEIVGTIPDDWCKYRVFGDERFSNGSAFICIDETDGTVRRIDVELENPLSLFATNAARFNASFRLLDQYFKSKTQTSDQLENQLRLADAEAFEAGSHWRLLSNYLKLQN